MRKATNSVKKQQWGSQSSIGISSGLKESKEPVTGKYQISYYTNVFF